VRILALWLHLMSGIKSEVAMMIVVPGQRYEDPKINSSVKIPCIGRLTSRIWNGRYERREETKLSRWGVGDSRDYLICKSD
jgi:hypothetical protein